MRWCTWFSVAALSVAPTMASAQWSDNFDSYAAGSINGLTTGGPNALGTWQGWDNLASAAGTVSTAQFLSAPNSQAIGGSADSVHRFQGATSGVWTFSAMQYIPSNVTGTTYFILMNNYVDGGATTVDRWSTELRFNLTTGMVDEDLLGNPSPGTTARPIVRDVWVPINVSIDLGANTQTVTYNGLTVFTGSWTRGTAGAVLEIEAVDLFNLSSTGNIYYDNISLVPAPASLALLAMGGVMAGRRRRV